MIVVKNNNNKTVLGTGEGDSQSLECGHQADTELRETLLLEVEHKVEQSWFPGK